MQRLEIARPDDWHLHLRDGAALRAVVAHTAERFARAIVMPNLRPPVGTIDDARAYRDRILDAAGGADFEPLMTLYLTPSTTADDVRAAANADFVHAIKLYPAGATTNSDAGIDDLQSAYPLLEVMESAGLPLLVHGETTDPSVDVFDREAVFIEQTLRPIVVRFPGLRVVLEHVTTADAVAFVESAASNVAATITAHHLLLNRNHIFEGGIRPDRYCLPILKRERHRRALVAAATSGSPKFFLGTDSAPHGVEAKHAPCGCAGCYTAHAGIELYAEAFDDADALDRLEAFASHHGPDFYGLARNQDRIVLVKEAWTVPESYPFGDSRVTPLRAGASIAWRLA